MVVSPLLRGMFGLSTDANTHTLTFAPHPPADWMQFSIENLHLGNTTLLLNYKKEGGMADPKTPGGIVLEAGRTSGSEECMIEFRPAISLRAKVQKVDLNFKPISFRVETSGEDQHVVVRFPVKEGKYIVRIYTTNDFGFSTDSLLPALGSESKGLRILSETWSPSRDQLSVEVSGQAGGEYELKLWDADEIQKVDGADRGARPGWQTLWIQIPQSASERYPHKKVVFHFFSKVPPG
jgi:hypothetical protein